MPILPGLTFHSTCAADMDQVPRHKMPPGWTPFKQLNRQRINSSKILVLRATTLKILLLEYEGIIPVTHLLTDVPTEYQQAGEYYMRSARQYFSAGKGEARRQALEECVLELHLWLEDCAIRDEIDTLLFDAVTGMPLTVIQGQ